MYKKSGSDIRLWIKKLFTVMAVLMVAGLLTGRSLAYSQKDPHAQMLGGPYELMVKRGMQGAEMFFPVEVENTGVQSELGGVFPVMGSSAKIRLEQFLPDLVWEQYTEKSPDGGSVVRFKAVGPDLDQKLWLCAEEADKQSMSSAIGSMSIKKMYGKIDLKKMHLELTDPDVIGILTVWANDPNVPMVYLVSEGADIKIKDTPYQINVLEYMPHYSVDTETKAIHNASPDPKNPAIRIGFTEKDTPVEQWIFSRFPSHPHIASQIPFRVEFSDLDPGPRPGNYVILASTETSPLILYRQGATKRVEPIELNKPYPLAGDGYNFVIEEVFSDVVLKQRWKNNRDQLLNPTIIATVDWDDLKEKVVLELNKPQHVRSDTETMVFLFRRKVEFTQHLE